MSDDIHILNELHAATLVNAMRLDGRRQALLMRDLFARMDDESREVFLTLVRELLEHEEHKASEERPEGWCKWCKKAPCERLGVSIYDEDE